MTDGAQPHVPVLLEAVLEQLEVRPSGTYIDCTFGRGGHSRALLERLDKNGRLVVIDQDPQAFTAARTLAEEDSRVIPISGSFGSIESIARTQHVLGQADGMLADLGVSSPQLDDAERGFSFLRDGPLDMRMNPAAGLSAAAWLNAAGEGEMLRVIARLGEERAARRIVRAIVARRAEQPFSRTLELAGLIEGVIPRRGKGKHPATRTFQAIRMHINGELTELQSFLEQFLSVLRVGGRLCIISFHSLEDRLVKRYLRDRSRVDPALARMPVVPADAQPVLAIPTGAIRADAAEVAANPRSRSAVLRVAERLR
ncbi:MAG: 16S rRNA (cytosine(1402)-N(4))-methyltransferase RsmH [Gammaproteobacteria bacterium]|jgi:16S rRNA (cytosine1402-N4)-methyltransferase|nr:16S rRNA (cytosine(1402)-N(4))-methyltransferase RsmH [Gammaproteobacteria bacterium]